MFSAWLLESRWLNRVLIYGLAILIFASSWLYSRYLASQLAERESKSIQLYAGAIEVMRYGTPGDTNAFYDLADFITVNFIIDDNDIPRVLKTENSLEGYNVSLEGDSLKQMKQLNRYKKDFASINDSIKVEFAPGRYNIVYYGESSVLRQLRYFPIVQVLVVVAFALIVFIGFAIAKRNEQNRVWVGLAKETAHQLGTPVSSLMAWIELLKLRAEEHPQDLELVNEMERDVKRLEKIADRFSKIGSQPELVEESLSGVLDRSAEYLKKRMTRSGSIQLHVNNRLPIDSQIPINPQLFDWVIENLLKNALDALPNGKGEINLSADAKGHQYIIDVSDTGKGIPKNNFQKVFEPGFTTKKRGWGLGLSLSKRIVENYHKGKIFVKSSEVGKGTTFRILMPKAKK